MLRDGTNIIPGSGGRSALHGVRQRAHRQKRPERLRPPTVSLPGMWGEPGARAQKPGNGPGAQSGSACVPWPPNAEPAGGPARLWRGAWHDLQVARKKAARSPAVERHSFCLPEAGDVLELDELWSFVGSKANAALGVDRALPPDPPGRGVLRGRSFRRQCPCPARAHPARLPLPRHPQRLLAGVRRGLSSPHPPLAPARAQARPVTSSVGTALCANAWAASCAKRSPFPSATGCTNSPCVCSFITTTCPLINSHYPFVLSVRALPIRFHRSLWATFSGFMRLVPSGPRFTAKTWFSPWMAATERKVTRSTSTSATNAFSSVSSFIPKPRTFSSAPIVPDVR